MQDIAKVMDADGLLVLATKDGDLVTVDGMESAVRVSLFTNARLDESEMPDPMRRGGWIGNLLSGRQLGGKLHALENARITTAYVGKAKEFAARSLDWMTEDNVSRGVSNSVSVQKQHVQHSISIVARDGVKYDYRYLWLKTRPFDLRIV